MYTSFYASIAVVALLANQSTALNLTADSFAEINTAMDNFDGTAEEFYIDQLAQVGFENGEAYLAQIEDTMSPQEFDQMLVNPTTYTALAQLTKEELDEMRTITFAETRPEYEREEEDERESRAQVDASAEALAEIETSMDHFDGTAEEFFIAQLAAVGVEEGEDILAQIETTMGPEEFDQMLVDPQTYHNLAQLDHDDLEEMQEYFAETRPEYEREEEDERESRAQVGADAEALATIQADIDSFDGTAEEFFIERLAQAGVEEGEKYLAQIETTMDDDEFDHMLVNPQTYHNLAQLTQDDLQEMQDYFTMTGRLD